MEEGQSGRARGGTVLARAHAYFASDHRRAIQSALGVIWLLDGGLQLQSFMYSGGFVRFLLANASGQPGWLASSIEWGAHTAQHNLAVWNTLFALTQLAIGFGLLYRPTVKLALGGSFAWVLVVWWVGEGFGMLFMNMANPLTGAPGAALLYAIVGMLVWPNGQPGGLLGVRGAKLTWAALWLVMAWLWLMGPNSSANATHDAINAAPSGMSWLSTVQDWAAEGAQGNGLVIALLLAAVSAVLGIAVAIDWRPRQFLVLAIVLNLLYWVLGQGFGGIFEGGATDPNAGLLFVLLALALYPLTPAGRPRPRGAARRASLAAGALAAIALLAGCAKADKQASMSAPAMSTSITTPSAGTGSAAPTMNMSASSSPGGVTANGVKPVPVQVLGTADWQGMKITAQVMTPVPFVVYDGTSKQVVKPGKASFHLMVMLNDADTGVPIPYATVWATITKNGKVVFDERQWPMIARYMGPHYGNDVTLPGPGTYKLSLLISPPVSARHVEYANVWLKPHQVSFTFPWKPT
ncbi:MAG: iron transporter [Solirubrobacteraceae bacterium]